MNVFLLDSDGYAMNFAGLAQVIEQTWNFDNGSFDQNPNPTGIGNFRILLNELWDGVGNTPGVQQAIVTTFQQKTISYVQGLGSGYDIEGGVPNVNLPFSDSAELRAKQDDHNAPIFPFSPGQFLLFKYLVSGSEDFVVDIPKNNLGNIIAGNPHVTINFDIEIDISITVATNLMFYNTLLSGGLGAQALLVFKNVQISGLPGSVDQRPIITLIESQTQDVSAGVQGALDLIINKQLAAEGGKGFPLLSFALDPSDGGTVNFFASQNTYRFMNLNIVNFQDPIQIPNANPLSLTLIDSSPSPQTSSWLVDERSGRFVAVTLSMTRTLLPPITIVYHVVTIQGKRYLQGGGQLIDPTVDFPAFWQNFDKAPAAKQAQLLNKRIYPPSVPSGVIKTWRLKFDLKTGQIVGDATGTAGQELLVGTISGPAISFTLSATTTWQTSF